MCQVLRIYSFKVFFVLLGRLITVYAMYCDKVFHTANMNQRRGVGQRQISTIGNRRPLLFLRSWNF